MYKPNRIDLSCPNYLSETTNGFEEEPSVAADWEDAARQSVKDGTGMNVDT